jgi:hypothetical protein
MSMAIAEFVRPPAPSARASRVLGRLLACAFVGGMLIGTLEYAITRAAVGNDWSAHLTWLARLAVHWGLAAVPLGLCLATVQLRASGRVPSLHEYVIALVVGATVGATVLALHGKYVDGTISQTASGLDLPLTDRFLYGAWQLAFWGAVATLLHASTLRQAQVTAALQSGTVARLQTEQRLGEAQLEALHARIEPEFLLQVLRRIEALYEHDATRADRALDALIGFLREAVPMLRRPSSTAGQECHLLRSYVAVFDAAIDIPATVHVECDSTVESAPLPPGALLELAQHFTGDGAMYGLSLTVRVSRTGSTAMRLELHAPTAGHADEPGLRERVAAFARRVRTTGSPEPSYELRRRKPYGLTLLIDWTDPREGPT